MEERVGWRDVRFSETQKRTLGISLDSLNILKPMTRNDKSHNEKLNYLERFGHCTKRPIPIPLKPRASDIEIDVIGTNCRITQSIIKFAVRLLTYMHMSYVICDFSS